MNTQLDIILPRSLQLEDNIAIISPASPVNAAEIKAGLDIIHNKGLKSILGPNLTNLKTHGIYAAPLVDRVNELHWAFSDTTIKGIIVATGGFGCAQLLPYLSYDLIRKNPKILLGYSDVTALNCAILKYAGVTTFHGPSISIRQGNSEDTRLDKISLEDAIDLLMYDGVWLDIPFKRNCSLPRCVYPGHVSGIAIGGNLTTLACLLGTPFFPNIDNTILFIEDIDEGGYEVLRLLTHLELAGIFDKVAGVVCGEFYKAPEQVDPGDPSIEDVIVEIFENKKIPCITGFNFSHGDTTAIIPIGGYVTLDAGERNVVFETPMRVVKNDV